MHLVKPPENRTSIDVRKGMPPRKLDRASFQERFFSAFIDPSFDQLQRELKAVADAAWDAYADSRKSPLTRKADPGSPTPTMNLRTIGLPPATPSRRQRHITTMGQRRFCW